MPTYYIITRLEDCGDDLPTLLRCINDAELEGDDGNGNHSESSSITVPDDLVKEVHRIFESV